MLFLHVEEVAGRGITASLDSVDSEDLFPYRYSLVHNLVVMRLDPYRGVVRVQGLPAKARLWVLHSDGSSETLWEGHVRPPPASNEVWFRTRAGNRVGVETLRLELQGPDEPYVESEVLVIDRPIVQRRVVRRRGVRRRRVIRTTGRIPKPRSLRVLGIHGPEEFVRRYWLFLRSIFSEYDLVYGLEANSNVYFTVDRREPPRVEVKDWQMRVWLPDEEWIERLDYHILRMKPYFGFEDPYRHSALILLA